MIPLDRNCIRKTALARRRALSEEEVSIYSKTICHKVQPYIHGKVAMYHAYGKEVDVSYLSFRNATLVALPKTYSDDTIKFFEIQAQTIYRTSSFGIVEPDNGREVYAKDIDVMLIPLVAFDDECHRIGHGKGFYDRYLTNFTGLRIGVAYECQKFDFLPVLQYDESLDMIISESCIYTRVKNN